MFRIKTNVVFILNRSADTQLKQNKIGVNNNNNKIMTCTNLEK